MEAAKLQQQRLTLSAAKVGIFWLSTKWDSQGLYEGHAERVRRTCEHARRSHCVATRAAELHEGHASMYESTRAYEDEDQVFRKH